MSGFTEYRASGASEQAGLHDLVLTWGLAHDMLPLVERIARDVVACHARLAELRPELRHLERHRQSLDWPRRSRRYQIQEEVDTLEEELRKAQAECDALGLTFLHARSGLVGFPTIVNDRRAFFSWQPGEEGPLFWNYAGDSARRPVPAAWMKTLEEEQGGRRKR